MGLKGFLSGFVFCLLIVGCAGASYPYKYFALSADSYSGSLLGPKPSDDLPLSVCTPTAQDKSPCIVIQTPTFLNMKKEYKNLQNKLIQCERFK